jgi:hypothetical protein
MRKSVLFLVLFIIASYNLAAQVSYDIDENFKRLASSFDINKLQFGLKVSPAISWINAEHYDVQSDGATMKFGIGAIANYELTSLISFVSGLNYNGFGGYVYDNASLSLTYHSHQLQSKLCAN